MTTYAAYDVLYQQIFTYQQATFFFCLLISIAIFLLLPAKIERYKRITSSILIFIGLFGLFTILLKTLLSLL